MWNAGSGNFASLWRSIISLNREPVVILGSWPLVQAKKNMVKVRKIIKQSMMYDFFMGSKIDLHAIHVCCQGNNKKENTLLEIDLGKRENYTT